MTDLLWRIFEKTGAVSHFLFYKALEECEQQAHTSKHHYSKQDNFKQKRMLQS